MTIENAIIRLAKINCTASMIKLNDKLKTEKQSILNLLKDRNVITIDDDGRFEFIGNDSRENNKLYLNSLEDF
jgi:hypothetical protein